MRRLLFVLVTVLVLATSGVAQQDSSTTIWFYRSLVNANDQPAYVYWVNMPTRLVTTLKSGEYFGLPVPAGTYSFAYVHAPARGQSVLVTVKSGEHAYVEVTPKSIENTGQIDMSVATDQHSETLSGAVAGSAKKP
jgi:hypothetical protein